MRKMYLENGSLMRALIVIVNGVAIRSQVLALESLQRQHRTASRIEVIRVQVLPVLVGEEVEYSVFQLVRVLIHTNVEIMVVVGSKNFQRVGRGVQVLLAVDYLGGILLGRRGCDLQNMGIEPVDFEAVLNQTGCSKEVVAHGVVCD
jgi:hypothetical protein